MDKSVSNKYTNSKDLDLVIIAPLQDYSLQRGGEKQSPITLLYRNLAQESHSSENCPDETNADEIVKNAKHRVV